MEIFLKFILNLNKFVNALLVAITAVADVIAVIQFIKSKQKTPIKVFVIIFFTIVLLILAVGAVLVLHLHHDDIAAAGDLTLGQDGHERIVVARDAREELGVARTGAHGAIGEQPCRQAAELPLAARERRGAHDDPKAELCRLIKEAGHVGDALEIEDARLGLVQVPRHVGLNSVETHRLQVVQRVMPVRRMNTEVVNRAGEDGEGFTVE